MATAASKAAKPGSSTADDTTPTTTTTPAGTVDPNTRVDADTPAGELGTDPGTGLPVPDVPVSTDMTTDSDRNGAPAAVARADDDQAPAVTLDASTGHHPPDGDTVAPHLTSVKQIMAIVENLGAEVFGATLKEVQRRVEAAEKRRDAGTEKTDVPQGRTNDPSTLRA